MPPRIRLFILAVILLGMTCPVFSESAGDPLAAWKTGVKIHPVSPEDGRHTIHSYFNTCPESPDGKWVLFFSSTTPEGQTGEVHIRDRVTGEERVLVKNLNVEDAHRVACQQWISGGRRVVFHGERNGAWFVGCVDLATGEEKVMAKNRLASWGQTNGDLVPLYGPHWNPGEHRNLELLNVATGEIQTALTVQAVQEKYPEFLSKQFGDKPISIFFPVLSPDAQRVFFKMAAAGNGNPRSKGASAREGLICYSLEQKRFLFLRPQWGHPAWHSDNRTIVETAFTLIDSNDGASHRVPGLPVARGDHPSASPDGSLLVTDSTMDRFEGDAKEWGIIVANAQGNHWEMLQHFDNSHGAKSWRVSHPHPVFSPDGKRIYFNVSSGSWTQLYVAERGE